MPVGFPYWRLAGFYFIYFAFVGAFTPYWSLYLQSLNFSAFQIGVLMSLLQVARIFAPNMWGWLADHTNRRVFIVQIAALFTLIGYLGVFLSHSFLWMFLVMAVMSFFWSASLPLVEAITMGHLKHRTEGYGRVRVWGSIGFIIAVLVVGCMLDKTHIDTLLWAVLGLLVGSLITSGLLPEPVLVKHQSDQASVSSILNQQQVKAFFAACFLMAAAHGVYYTFYSIYLVEHGYSKTMVGWLWALGVICEVVVFLFMPLLTRAFRLRSIFLASFALAGLRFMVIGWGVDSLILVLLSQTLHAASFGSYHAVAVAYTHRFFQGRHQSKGQGFYTSISFGLGGTLGGVLCGYIWEPIGSAWTFTVSALFAWAGLLVLSWWFHPEEQKY